MRINLSRYPSAPKIHTLDFPRLDGGLNLRELDYRLAPNQSPDMQNLWWQDGVLQCRDGQVYLSDSESLGTGFTAAGSLFWDRAFFHIGSGLFYGDTNAEHFELTPLCSGVPENRGTFFRYLDWLFYKNKGGFYRIEYKSDTSAFEAKSVVDLAQIPVVQINTDPVTGAGDLYQPENRLTAQKTVRYTPKENTRAYTLPVKPVDSVALVTVNGVEVKDFTVALESGSVSFEDGAPDAAGATVEITYSKADENTEEAFNSIMDCEYAMVAGGDANLCILLAGCDAQPNAVFWNDRDSLSMDPAYFPMPYYNLVGDTEDPVTGFGRQYSDIIVFKEHSVGKLNFGIEDLDGRNSISFTYTNVNHEVGCDLPWSIQLIENNLVFCNTYQGAQILRSSSAAYENNIECISRNVNGHRERGLLFDLRAPGVVSSFDDDNRYWVCANGHTYVWDYVLSSFSDPSWFYFTGINAVAFFRDGGQTSYHLDPAGRVTKFARTFADYDSAIAKSYTFPTQDFGGYDRLKDVESILVALRSDTNTDIHIQYHTDYETRSDLSSILSYRWGLIPRNLSLRCLAVPRYASTFRRKPGCRHIRHFAMTFSNADPYCDMAIVSAQIFFTYQGRVR